MNQKQLKKWLSENDNTLIVKRSSKCVRIYHGKNQVGKSWLKHGDKLADALSMAFYALFPDIDHPIPGAAYREGVLYFADGLLIAQQAFNAIGLHVGYKGDGNLLITKLKPN